MSLALIKKIEFQSTVFAMQLNISIQFADFYFVLCQVNILNIARDSINLMCYEMRDFSLQVW